MRDKSGAQEEVVEDAQIENGRHQNQFYAKGRGDLEAPLGQPDGLEEAPPGRPQ